MSHPMLPLLERTPVIPAVKEPETLERALCHDGAAVFLLCGDILNIAGLVDRRSPWTICAPAEPTESSPPGPTSSAGAGSWAC